MERYSFDREYLERLARGEPEVERHFAAYFGELLLIKLRARVRFPQVIADLRQETFVRVLRALRKKDAIAKPESLGSFVNSVCDNVLLEFFRSGKNTPPVEHPAVEPVDPSRSIESELITEERAQMVQEILAGLSASDRKLLRGVFIEDRDKDQICAELKVDRSYLRVLLHRALARFRTSLLKKEQLSRATGAGG